MIEIFEKEFFLTPAECNPQQQMPVTLLINRLIEVATLHANELGVGYASLVDYHRTWVLSRVAVEMERWPEYNETYTIRTWVCSLNRLFSERDFEVLDGQGKTLGFARTVWAVIDTFSRTAVDISDMDGLRNVIPDNKVCPIAQISRFRPPVSYKESDYTFTFCDLDFNRHVNSSRYIELLLNHWTLDFHDHNVLRRFEIAYIHEAYYAEHVCLRMSAADATTGVITAELAHEDNALCRALLTYVERRSDEK